jgi:hypothetical protein
MQHLDGVGETGEIDLQTWALPVHASGMVLADLCDVPGPGNG